MTTDKPARRPDPARVFEESTALVTGHTGFKGAWLSQWLQHLGAHVHGFALAPHASPNLHETVAPETFLSEIIGEIGNFELVQKALMSNIGLMAGVGAPTSLAIDLAKRFDMTLLGFVKNNSFNIYSNKERVVIKS